MVTLTFDIPNECIIVELPDTSVSVQEIWDKSQEFLGTFAGMSVSTFIFGAGKTELSGGLLTGITITLVDWRIQFRDRPGPTTEIMEVSGGNTVGRIGSVIGPAQHPIKPAAFTHTILFQSTQAALINPIISQVAVHLEATYDEGTTTVNINTWVERGGSPVVNPISTKVDWYEPTGPGSFTLLFTATSSTPDSRGNFNMSAVETLSPNTEYYADVEVTDSFGTISQRRGAPSVGN